MGFIYFNPNPQQKLVGDCTIRAISLLTERDWEQVYISLTLLGFEDGISPTITEYEFKPTNEIQNPKNQEVVSREEFNNLSDNVSKLQKIIDDLNN